MTGNYYQELQVPRNASFGAIDDAYNKLSRELSGNQEKLDKVAEAWATLSNPLSRAKYDRALDSAEEKTQQVSEREAKSVDKDIRESDRPSTEVIDLSALSLRKSTPRPQTEIIDLSSLPPQTNDTDQDTSTEITDEGKPARSRPVTEVIKLTPDDIIANEAPPQPAVDAQISDKYNLTVIADDGSETHYNFDVDKTHKIGRRSKSGPKPTIPLNDLYVSRAHAELTQLGGELVLIDKNSANGTRLNGEALEAERPYALKDGDRIEIESFTLQIRINEEDK